MGCIFPVSYTHLDVYKRQAPVMVIIVITLLAAYDGMSAVSTCIGDIFGLHAINPGYDSASASLQLMVTAIRTATLFACRKESKTSANGDKTKDSKNKIKRTTVIRIGDPTNRWGWLPMHGRGSCRMDVRTWPNAGYLFLRDCISPKNW